MNIMSRTKKEFKWFTIPQYEQEQDYLSKMHRNGWKLTKVTFPGYYHFEECEPEDVVYQLDYNQEGVANKEEYTQLFADCGWEYLFDFVGYSYFRKPREDQEENTAIFCDDESRLDMMRRVYKGRMVPLLCLFFGIILPQLALQISGHHGDLSRYMLIAYLVLFFGYIGIFATFGYQFYQYEQKVLAQPEKTKTKFVALFLGLGILALIVGVAGAKALKGRASVYSLLEQENGYIISAEYFDELLEWEFMLEEGDEIWFEVEHLAGEYSLVIGREGEEPIFTGRGTLEEKFSVTVSEAGCYKISCEGKAVKGNLSFSIK